MIMKTKYFNKITNVKHSVLIKDVFDIKFSSQKGKFHSMITKIVFPNTTKILMELEQVNSITNYLI